MSDQFLPYGSGNPDPNEADTRPSWQRKTQPIQVGETYQSVPAAQQPAQPAETFGEVNSDPDFPEWNEPAPAPAATPAPAGPAFVQAPPAPYAQPSPAPAPQAPAPQPAASQSEPVAPPPTIVVEDERDIFPLVQVGALVCMVVLVAVLIIAGVEAYNYVTNLDQDLAQTKKSLADLERGDQVPATNTTRINANGNVDNGGAVEGEAGEDIGTTGTPVGNDDRENGNNGNGGNNGNTGNGSTDSTRNGNPSNGSGTNLSGTNQGTCISGGDFARFTPGENWWTTVNNLPPVAPSESTFMSTHNLGAGDVQDVRFTPAVWEPGLFVVELDEELYGKYCLQLQTGFVYTVPLTGGQVEILVGGDPNVPSVQVLWGFSARWIPAYHGKAYGLGGWLSIEDPTELAVREHRFGRYLRNPELEGVVENIPYFNRFGPYYTGTGNLDIDWVPPALSKTAPEDHDYRTYSTFYGGRAVKEEWTIAEDGTASWRYYAKVAGSANYCSPNDPCFQGVYIPSKSPGYVTLWVGNGPQNFYAEDLDILMNGDYFVDEFSVHPFGD